LTIHSQQLTNDNIATTGHLAMKILTFILCALIAGLQYQLWNPQGGFARIKTYEQQLVDLQQEVEEKKQRNEALYAEVEDLRKGQEALEERARDELGMIRENETFVQVIE
jgi:cell division protein FtsB